MTAMRRSAMDFAEPMRAAYHRTTESRMPTPWAVLGMIGALAGGAVLGFFGDRMYLTRKVSEDNLTGTWCIAPLDEGELAAPGAIDEGADERYEGE